MFNRLGFKPRVSEFDMRSKLIFFGHQNEKFKANQKQYVYVGI